MLPVATELIEPDFLGFNLVRHRHLFAAFHMSLGPLDPDELSPQWWGEQTLAGTAVTAADPIALKAHILKFQVARWQSQEASREGAVNRVDSLQHEQEQRLAAQDQRFAAQERRFAATENASNQLVMRVDSLERRLEQRVASLELLLPALTAIEQRVAGLESQWWHRAASWAEARLRSILSAMHLRRPLEALRRQLGRSLS
jgi:hypothetical protein